ncbi:hypothetical protein [Siminovitchia fordii]|uniref:Uncharacterized protein n=1 Tax=Siminovitchia fordii TaxID=254759 RepID=A0ABQ4KA05_9BACI|nr:hypothetical protein [Siminovitchia fordii]GIN22552.1 hypothetical protein J1TS3_36860 [Siminovitchia fordii]
MVRIIETNLSLNCDDKIIDHQSRVTEVESWSSYVVEIGSGESVSRGGSMPGFSLPRGVNIDHFDYDEHHLTCDFQYLDGMKIKHLAYLIKE